MAVPKFNEFLYPFLYLLKDGDKTKRELTAALIAYFKLTEEDCNIKTKSGQTTQLMDRIGWTLQYLRRAQFVNIPQRATYTLTERAKEYLSNHKTLSQDDLLEYPEFAEFSNRKRKEGTLIATPIVETSDMTPTEQLETAYESILKDLGEEILQKTLEQSPQFFEKLVLDLLLKMGYGNPTDNSARVTPFVHDEGIDGIIPQDRLGLDKIYIQAKRYQPGNIVGKPAIQAFSGALDEQKATKGVFITTSSYSKEARSYIDKTSKKIILIDGSQLSRLMIEYNVGVSVKRTYEVKRIDSDYFED